MEKYNIFLIFDKNIKLMDAPIYGILDSDNVHHDVSKTERGAKIYATRNGYNKVSKRVGYNARCISVKLSTGKWCNEGSKLHNEYLNQ